MLKYRNTNAMSAKISLRVVSFFHAAIECCEDAVANVYL